MNNAAALAARQGSPAQLAQALRDSRSATLATFDAYQSAGRLVVPQHDAFNPPLWELGHIGWFQQWWLGRNPQRTRGAAADPLATRSAAARAETDALYDSSRVPHATRWSLPLPDADATRAELAAQLEETLALLTDCAHDDTALYFHRLVLLHEDMHHEAAHYMAQALAIDMPRPPLQPAGERVALRLPAAAFDAGWADQGFAFDNELGAHTLQSAAFEIDSRPIAWSEFLPFVDAGGYADPRWWSAAGSAWLRQHGLSHPRDLRRSGSAWQQRIGSRWLTLDMHAPACHLSAFEAQAWCAWAGRRLPTEAEWERAAVERAGDFVWGDVWEWTASPFAPYPGFVPHPYRDYSLPWFDGRPVLRGASMVTPERLRHPRFRNYFPPGRNDIFAGFRSCAGERA